jgi:NAD(P)-dependent dehydrogenase (short-subunit alcohol dehydrogenase family)
VIYPFAGKVALVTGGTDGIGLAAALGFVASGAKVMIVGRNPERGNRALQTLQGALASGAEAAFHAADMADPNAIAGMVAACLARFGRLDFAVNNAAAEFPLVPMTEIPEQSVELSIAVDLRGTWHCMKHEIEAMLKSGGGAIVNVSSVNGFASSPNAAMYSATKHGMNGLSTAAAREVIGKGIRINTVCPGAIETPRRQRRLAGFTPEQIEKHYADLAGKVPLGRVARAEEVAEGILWLCSDASSYVVGHHLVIDGGLTA